MTWAGVPVGGVGGDLTLPPSSKPSRSHEVSFAEWWHFPHPPRAEPRGAWHCQGRGWVPAQIPQLPLSSRTHPPLPSLLLQPLR